MSLRSGKESFGATFKIYFVLQIFRTLKLPTIFCPIFLGKYSDLFVVSLPSSGDAKKLHQQFLTCSTAKLSSAWGETLSRRIQGMTNSLTSSSPPHTDFQSLLLNISAANSFKRRKHARRQWVSISTFMAWPGLPGLSSLELRLHACTKYGNALRQLGIQKSRPQ